MVLRKNGVFGIQLTQNLFLGVLPMTNERIDRLLGYLAEISAFLSEVKFRAAENRSDTAISETVERYLDGFSNSLNTNSKNFPAPPRSIDALQLNRASKVELGIDKIFTEKELKTMPKLKDLSYRYKQDDCIHEFRYRRNGIDKSFSSRNLKIAKQKALDFCKQLNAKESTILDKDVAFNFFAIEYLKNIKQRNVSEKTFFNDYNRFENYIIPAFKNLKLRDVNAMFLQKFLNGVLDDGKKRTAEALYYILKSILDYAVNTDHLNKNPLMAVKIPLHERENGKALPLDVEKTFVNNIAGNKYELTFILFLYTGCRPCELESAVFEKDGFITFRNRKQKKNAVVYKDIPITPMLAPYADRIKKSLPLKTSTELGKLFAKLVPGYRLYDLRHTFATRCQECGVSQEVVARWLGHKTDRITDNVYTHFPPKYMLEQAKKVVY